jgi:hypothetical protein
LTSLNLASNGIGGYEDDADNFIATPEGRYSHTQSYCTYPTHIYLISLLTSGPAAIADAIKDMGALSVLSLKDNSLGTKEAGKVLGEMLKMNSVLKGLNLSDNKPDRGGDPAGFAQELALGLKDNGALSTLIFGDAPDEDSGSDSEEEGTDWEPAVLEVGMTDADFSNKNLGPGDAIIISAWISHNGALTKLDVSKNNLCADGGKALVAGIKGNQVITELNIAGNVLGKESKYPYKSDMSCVAALADVITGMGALSVLSLETNGLAVDGGKALAEGLKGNQVITELNIADNNLANYGADISGVVVLTDVIPDMGAMSKFTFSGDESWSKPVTMETTITEADFSGTDLGVSGGMLVAAFLPKCQ